MDRYNKLNKFYKEKFGERVLKICVDGGFTCPNRDGSKGYGGCAFCSERGSGEHIKFLDVAEQVRKHLDSYRGKRANKFIVYFQNFSNTYDSCENLRKVYDSALISDKIIGISIATRPDLISEDIVKLLATYKDKYYVMVELGLQTADDRVSKGLNLKYTVEDYIDACKLLNKYCIDVVTHMMIGLPNEDTESLDKTILVINQSGVLGVKIHNLYIVEGSKFHDKYLHGKIETLDVEDYLNKLEYVITRLKPEIIIHRISGDAPKDKLVAPTWNTKKKLVLNGIEKLMKENNSYQGCNYQE